MPAPIGTLRKWSWDAGRSGAARRRTSASTPAGRARTRRSAVTRTLPHHGHVAQRVDGVRRHRQQQLVVLAAVEREGEGVASAFLLEAGRAGVDGQGRGIEPGRHPARLAQRSEVARRARPTGPWRRARGRARPRARAKASGGAGSSCARRQRRSASGGARPEPAAATSPSASSRAPVPEEAQPRRARAQRARHHHEVAGRAPARRSMRAPPSPSSVMSTTIGPVVAATFPPTTWTPASAARSRSPSYRPSMKPMVTSGGRAEADGGEARRARHGGDVREVDGQGLAAEQGGRGPVAAEVHALDEAVGGDEGEGCRLHAPRRRPRCPPRPRALGHPRAQVLEQRSLPHLTDRAIGRERPPGAIQKPPAMPCGR